MFDSVSFTLSEGDRVGLIGPNGAGKSTLLRILAGEVTPERGELIRRSGLRIGYLPQVPRFEPEDNVLQAVRRGLARHLGVAMSALDWQAEAKVEETLAKLELSGDEAGSAVATLSGGYQKRVALACELAYEPDQSEMSSVLRENSQQLSST